jgi:hypothetical protein
MNTGKLVAVVVGSAKHLAYLEAGYRTHHTEGRIVWLEAPKAKV